jgi:microcystin-dependent protein
MDYLLGDILLLPYNFIPMGFMECDGRLLSVQQNQALFSLLGIIYGGDGQTTFGIPNLKGAEPVPGTHYCIATQGIYPMRD